jgi:hypothetical protein
VVFQPNIADGQFQLALHGEGNPTLPLYLSHIGLSFADFADGSLEIPLTGNVISDVDVQKRPGLVREEVCCESDFDGGRIELDGLAVICQVTVALCQKICHISFVLKLQKDPTQ